MSVTDLLAALQTNLAQTDITLYPGTSAQSIRRFEQQLNRPLPDDFRAFYSCCDGFESAEDLFRVVPLDEILSHPDNYQPGGRFTIAEYLIYSDTWEVELLGGPDSAAYHIVYAYKGREVVLTDSLAEFLGRFLRGGVFGADGLYAWAEQLAAPEV